MCGGKQKQKELTENSENKISSAQNDDDLTTDPGKNQAQEIKRRLSKRNSSQRKISKQSRKSRDSEELYKIWLYNLPPNTNEGDLADLFHDARRIDITSRDETEAVAVIDFTPKSYEKNHRFHAVEKALKRRFKINGRLVKIIRHPTNKIQDDNNKHKSF